MSRPGAAPCRWCARPRAAAPALPQAAPDDVRLRRLWPVGELDPVVDVRAARVRLRLARVELPDLHRLAGVDRLVGATMHLARELVAEHVVQQPNRPLDAVEPRARRTASRRWRCSRGPSARTCRRPRRRPRRITTTWDSRAPPGCCFFACHDGSLLSKWVALRGLRGQSIGPPPRAATAACRAGHGRRAAASRRARARRSPRARRRFETPHQAAANLTRSKAPGRRARLSSGARAGRGTLARRRSRRRLGQGTLERDRLEQPGLGREPQLPDAISGGLSGRVLPASSARTRASGSQASAAVTSLRASRGRGRSRRARSATEPPRDACQRGSGKGTTPRARRRQEPRERVLEGAPPVQRTEMIRPAGSFRGAVRLWSFRTFLIMTTRAEARHSMTSKIRMSRSTRRSSHRETHRGCCQAF